MRALVMSDTHFGAWTGEDLLRHDHELALLARHLDDIDELIFLGDLFDLLFSSVRDAVTAAGGLLDLLRDELQGKRFVFLAGNHDHHLIARAAEDLLERELATGEPPALHGHEAAETQWFRRFLERRLDGVQIELRYPTYTFGNVLCTHGHYLDFHVQRQGSLPNRVLGRALWSTAAGGVGTSTPSMEDYESVITMLTELLFTIAQLPHGTVAQHNVYASLQRAERIAQTAASPLQAANWVRAWLLRRSHPGGGPTSSGGGPRELTLADYKRARSEASKPGDRPDAPTGGGGAGYGMTRVTRPSDPTGPALNAFAEVVENLGWANDTDQIVFAHTHQPLAEVMPRGDAEVRYWNTGSWIYEPDLSSHDAYLAYLQQAWPGTAVLIDTDERSPRLIEIRKHLSPLASTEG